MARKNDRKSRRPAKSKPADRILWSTTDRLRLLAYLDWCVQSCIKFEVTAPGYLELTTGKPFSKERIHKKLHKEWQNYGICNKFNDLFELGTTGLTPLVGEEQENFQKLFRSINPARGTRCTRSRSLGLAARSGTLSRPHSTRSFSGSREPNERSTPEAGSSNGVPERLRQKTKAPSSLGPTRPASKNKLSGNELTRDQNTDRVKSENEFEPITIASPEHPELELEIAPTILDSQEDIMTVTSQAQLSSPLEERLRQLKADLLKQKSYSVTLENRISEIKRRHHDLEHCVRLASSAQGVEAQFRQVISSLKDRLERDRLLMESYDQLDADRLGFLNTSLGAEYDTLYSNIRDTSSTICYLSLDDSIPAQRTGFSHLVNAWARRVSGCDLGPLLSNCETTQVPKKIILVSLLVAGIFELVLEEVFPAFLAADSPLLDQYRKHIETQSGWNAVQRLDIVSIRSLLSDRNVEKEILSERSKWLSSLMLQTLSCFLPLEGRDMTQRPPNHELETETISDLRSTLFHALKTKKELMMSVKRLKYFFFRPGTLFNAERMEVDRSQAGCPASLSQEVKICLLPALFTVSDAGNTSGDRDEFNLKASYTEALAEATYEDIESLVLMEKAIVFL
ncbi:hypothetical protein CC79DRAFT_1328798 [Sarocladium strictum]